MNASPPEPGAPPARHGWPARAVGRIGLLGGSFNPAHDGHVHVSLMALRRLRLDAVWWLVSPQNPLKPADGMADLETRMAAARSVASHPRIHVTDAEHRLGTRYTIDTLATLVARCPRARFVWLMGADNMIQIPRWAHWERIFRTCPIAVLARPSYSLRAMTGKAAQRFDAHRVRPERAPALPDMKPPAWTFIPIPLHPASATAIRRGSTGRPAPHGGR